MKILFPSSTFYPAQIGGPNNTLYWHVFFLAQEKLNPIIVTTDRGVSSQSSIIRDKWFQRDFGRIIYLKEWISAIPFKIMFYSLRNLNNIDVVHFNSLFSQTTLFLIFIFTFTTKAIVLSPRGELFSSAVSRKKAKKKLVLLFYSLIKNRVLFHATSDEESKSIKKVFGSCKIVVQPNFIIPEYNCKPPIFAQDLLFLGRINPIKNIDLFIEAASKSIPFMESKGRILVAGEARLEYEKRYMKGLGKLIAKLGMTDKVLFLGHVESSQKVEIISKSYFLVLPSKSENFGNVVLEAMSCGTPVIASKGTPWSILESSKSGFWVESELNELTKTIDKAMTLNYKEYRLMSDSAMNLVKEEYDIYSSKNNWVIIYKNVTKTVKFYNGPSLSK